MASPPKHTDEIHPQKRASKSEENQEPEARDVEKSLLLFEFVKRPVGRVTVSGGKDKDAKSAKAADEAENPTECFFHGFVCG